MRAHLKNSTRCSWGAGGGHLGAATRSGVVTKIGVEREEAGGLARAKKTAGRQVAQIACLSGDYHHPQGRGSLLASASVAGAEKVRRRAKAADLIGADAVFPRAVAAKTDRLGRHDHCTPRCGAEHQAAPRPGD
jgi:hypothetical protein